MSEQIANVVLVAIDSYLPLGIETDVSKHAITRFMVVDL